MLLPRGLAVCRRLLATLGRVELVLAIVALVIVVALSTAQAGLRYLFGISMWWAQEIAEFTVLVTYFFGIAYVFKTRREIYIEFLTLMLPIRGQIALLVLEQVFTCVFAVAVLWLVLLFLPTMFNMQSPVLKLPGFVTYVPLVISSVSILLTSVYYGAFGVWAHRHQVGGQTIHGVEQHGLILNPWAEPL
ncbi:MAG TPA: TRAP transporter small permease subunit [Devosiaceae bacterium]|nr:TRAP transporter small permease subunit [Devosiaceae bacterium]